jgi:hypothetical protein
LSEGVGGITKKYVVYVVYVYYPVKNALRHHDAEHTHNLKLIYMENLCGKSAGRDKYFVFVVP